jgi:outer membrane protein
MTEHLTPLERRAIRLSCSDPAWSLKPQSNFARWARGRFGPLPFANERLEALRRYVVLSRRHSATLSRQQIILLSDADLDQETLQQVDQILACTPLAQASRGRSPRSRHRPMANPPAPWAGLARPTPRSKAATIFSVLASRTTGIFMRYPSFSSPQIITAVAMLTTMLWHGAAHAQAEPPIEDPLVGVTGDGPPNGPGNEDHFAIGVGVAYMPAYIGSDKYRAQPLPAIDIKYGRFFVNFQDGVGANLIDMENITIGAGVVMTDNRRAKDSPRGIGKVPNGAGARGFIKLRQGGFEAVLGGTQVFAGGTRGFVADASLSYPIMINERFMLAPSIGTTWGNRKHLDRYFGVNAQQSAASGLRQYRASSGFIDVKADVAAQYRLTDRIGLGVVAGVTTLVGDIKNSPIVKEKTRPFGLMFVTYEF